MRVGNKKFAPAKTKAKQPYSLFLSVRCHRQYSDSSCVAPSHQAARAGFFSAGSLEVVEWVSVSPKIGEREAGRVARKFGAVVFQACVFWEYGVFTAQHAGFNVAQAFQRPRGRELIRVKATAFGVTGFTCRRRSTVGVDNESNAQSRLPLPFEAKLWPPVPFQTFSTHGLPSYDFQASRPKGSKKFIPGK